MANSRCARARSTRPNCAAEFATVVNDKYRLVATVYKTDEHVRRLYQLPCSLTGPIVVVPHPETDSPERCNDIEGGVIEMAKTHGGKLVAW